MASQSLYRKWRSQTFADLVGQEAVTRTLLNAVREGRLAHAYLFCGPRGTGKTSAARLLAKAINCANPRAGEPCDECLSCREIAGGRSPDVIEIDAASNTGVDNIRDLRENASLLGSGGRYKLYIVDEAHMLSTQAFNALLKTLEEPPPHVIFVLATTEAHKVLPTVVSRCQRFDFRRIGVRAIVARLNHVARGEGLDLEPGAAELIARAAQGGLRDALSLLDQAMAYCGTRIDLEHTREMLGLADPGMIRTLIESVAEGDAAAGLHLIHTLVSGGADVRQAQQQLAEEWRALMLARAGADITRVMDSTTDEARATVALARRFTLDELMACARTVARTETPARGLPVPQLALELLFLECLRIHEGAQQPALDAPAARTPVLTQPGAAAPAAGDGRGAATQRQEPARAAALIAAVEDLDLAALDGASDAALPPVALAAAPGAVGAPADDAVALPSSDDGDVIATVRRQWQMIGKVCQQKSGKVKALLNDVHPLTVELGKPPVLVLEAAHEFHYKALREPTSSGIIEWAIEQVLDTSLRVRFVLAGRGATKTAKGRATGAAPDAPGPTPRDDFATATPQPEPPVEAYSGEHVAPAPPGSAAPRAQAGATATVAAPQPQRAVPETLDAEVRDDPIIQDILRACDAELVEFRVLNEDDA